MGLGFAPCGQWYRLDDADSFIESSRQQLVRCVQIETKTAVKNLKRNGQEPICGLLYSGAYGDVRLHRELNRVFEDHTSSLVDEAVAIINESGKSSGVSTGSDDPEIILLA